MPDSSSLPPSAPPPSSPGRRATPSSLSTTRRVRIATGSRLHLGMFSFGDPSVRQFGGVGLMVDRPGMELEIASRDAGKGDAPNADIAALTQRAQQFARCFAQACRLPAAALDSLAIRIVQAPPQHVGLGVGTQLALAVGRALEAWFGLTPLPVAELARRLGRGRRSAVGIHGFERGGLIVEAGKFPGDDVSPLVTRLEIPAAWRFVLLAAEHPPGLCGAAEIAAFERLAAVPRQVTARLCEEALLGIVPAVRTADARAFGAAVDRFGRMAGETFAGEQGGIYASDRVESLAAAARAAGALGVVQSSWGPTLAAVVEDQGKAEQLVARLQRDPSWLDVSATIACGRSNGAAATVEV